jgi:hypothetical protein
VLKDASSTGAPWIFASELSRYAWTRLGRGKPARTARALDLARRVAGVGSWILLPYPTCSRAPEPT